MTRVAVCALATVAPIVACVAPAGATTVGISPAELRFDGVQRGEVADRSIQIFTDTTAGTGFTLQPSGQIASWLTLFDLRDPHHVPITRIAAPPAGTNGGVGVQLTVPKTAANGSYSGTITLSSNLNVAGGAPGTTDLGARVAVTVTVAGSQVVAGELLSAAPAAPEGEVGLPLRISALVHNSGNVDLRPVVTVAITGEGASVRVAQAAAATIRPGDTGDVQVDWNDAGAIVGNYTAEVTASDRGAVLGRRTLSFRLVPAGTLRSAGELTSLRLASSTVPGGAAELVASFVNTGQLDTQAVLSGQVWRGKGLVGTISSLPLLVGPGQTGELTVIVETPDAGMYRVTGAVQFSGRTTTTRQLTFRVGMGRTRAQTALEDAMAIVALGLVATAGATVLRRRSVRPPEPA